MKEQVKAVGNVVLGGLVFLALLALPIVFIKGSLWAADRLLPVLAAIEWIALGIDAILLLPLSAIRSVRSFTGACIYLSSLLFGAITWLFGFIVTYALWGILGVVIGFFMMGIGVVPLGMIAALLNGMWEPLLILLVLTVLTFGTRFIGLAIAGGSRNHANQFT